MKYYEILCMLYIFYELITYNSDVVNSDVVNSDVVNSLINPPLCKY